jgi:hypothetical protein
MKASFMSLVGAAHLDRLNLVRVSVRHLRVLHASQGHAAEIGLTSRDPERPLDFDEGCMPES